MIDSSNDYAKYKPQVKKPEDIEKPYIGNYDMNKPDAIRAYADAMAIYNEKYEKCKEQLAIYRQAQNEGIMLFHDDLLQDGLNEGIGRDALEEAWHLALSHGSTFGDWDQIYHEIEIVAKYASQSAYRRGKQDAWEELNK